MVAPRKYRNQEERERIKEETLTKLGSMPVSDEDEKAVREVMESYCSLSCGKTLMGEIELPSLEAKIEYNLPGRRILAHYVKMSRLDKSVVEKDDAYAKDT